jgi:hypothetical protein
MPRCGPARRKSGPAVETARVAENVPDCITLRRHRDHVGRSWHIWVRRGLLGVPLLVVVLALANVFGQRPSTLSAQASAASLRVYAPTRVRGGLLFEARFHIDAHQTLANARLVLGSGWLEGMSVNTIEPSPSSETSRDGSLQLDLGRIPAGESFLLFMQFQVNPTNVGHRGAAVDLYDGDRRVLHIDRSITVYP